MTHNSKTGTAFIAGGTIAGAGVSATVGGMGLAGGFGAVGIGTVPVVGAGAVVGAAAYGVWCAYLGLFLSAVYHQHTSSERGYINHPAFLGITLGIPSNLKMGTFPSTSGIQGIPYESGYIFSVACSTQCGRQHRIG